MSLAAPVLVGLGLRTITMEKYFLDLCFACESSVRFFATIDNQISSQQVGQFSQVQQDTSYTNYHNSNNLICVSFVSFEIQIQFKIQIEIKTASPSNGGVA